MKKIFLYGALIFSLLFHSQTIEDFNNLPESLKEELLEEVSFDQSKKTLIGDRIIEEENTNLEEEKEVIFPEEEFFGFDFFNEKNRLNSPIFDIPLQPDYKISYRDELQLILTGGETKVYTLSVNLAGEIVVPEIGSIQVANMQLSFAREKVQAFIDQYLVGVKVNLSISNAAFKKVTIIGAVKEPGSYIINPFSSVSSIIEYAGGLKEGASIRNIQLNTALGTKTEVDLYDLLIFGKRTSDVNVSNGDVIYIPFTDKFAKVTGEIYRPMIYEYKSSDSIGDLVSFAEGLTFLSDKNSIFLTSLVDSAEVTKKVSLQQKVGSTKIEKLLISNRIISKNNNLLVSGRGVKNKVISLGGKKKRLEDVIKEVNFSRDIYPFYAKTISESQNGLSRLQSSFSLADINTMANLEIEANSILFFMSRDLLDNFQRFSDQKLELIKEIEIAIETEETEEIKKKKLQLKDLSFFDSDISLEELNFISRINNEEILTFRAGENTFLLPYTGNFSPRKLFEFLNISGSYDFESCTTIQGEKVIVNSYDKITYFVPNTIVNIPKLGDNFIEVTIKGEVQYPGTYFVDRKSTLQDIYDIAGGFLPSANADGILFSRESLKSLEKEKYNQAKQILLNSLVSNASNSTKFEGQIDASIFLLLEKENSDFFGRLSGDLSPLSEQASSILLQEGDLIVVPAISNTIYVAGQVQNPTILSYDQDFTVNDYLDAAGGLTKYADKSNLYIIKPNGTSIKQSTLSFREYKLKPGDTIVIPRNLERVSGFPLLLGAADIISNLAISAASLNALRN